MMSFSEAVAFFLYVIMLAGICKDLLNPPEKKH